MGLPLTFAGLTAAGIAGLVSKTIQNLFCGTTVAENISADGQYAISTVGAGTARLVQPKRFYNFDGVNDLISLSTGTINTLFSGASAVSVSCWVNWDVLTAGDNKNRIIQGLVGGGSSGVFMSVQESGTDTGLIRVGGRSSVADSFQVFNGSTLFPKNEWVHFVGILDYVNDKIYGYVNAVKDLDQTAVFANSSWTSGTPTSLDSIGNSGVTTSGLNGGLFDLRVFNRHLTDEDITSLADTDTAPSSALDTSGHWKGDDTHTKISYDSSGNGNDGVKNNITASTFNAESAGVPYSWQNKVGYSRGVNIAATATSGWTASGVWIAQASLDSDFSVSFEVRSTNKEIIYGVRPTNVPSGGSNYADFKHGVRWFTGGVVGIWVDGTEFVLTDLVAVGDIFKITRTGSTIVTFVNGVEVDSRSTSTASMYSSVATNGSGLSTTLLDMNGLEINNGYLGDDIALEDRYIPRDESDNTKDIIGNDLDYSDIVPANGQLIESNCATLGTGGGIIQIDVDDASTSISLALLIRYTSQTSFDYMYDQVSPRLIIAASGSIASELSFNNGTWRNFGTGANIPDDGELHWVVISIDGSTNLARAMIDGHYVGATIGAGTAHSFSNAGDQVIAGTATTLSGNCPSRIADYRLYRKALTLDNARFIKDPSTGVDPGTDDLIFQLPLAEETGFSVYNVAPGASTTPATILNGTSSTVWANTQDKYHYNLSNGFRLSGGVRIPALLSGASAADGNAITNSPGLFNGAETKINLDYAGGLPPIYKGYGVFNGTSSYVNCDAVASGMSGATSVTMKCKFKTTSTSQGAMIAINQSGNANILLVFINHANPGVGGIAVLDSGSTLFSIPGSYNDGVEHTLEITADTTGGSTITIDEVETTGGGNLATAPSGSSRYSIGQEFDASASDFWNGSLRDAEFMNGTVPIGQFALTKDTLDSSGNSNNGINIDVTFPTIAPLNAYSHGDDLPKGIAKTVSGSDESCFETKVPALLDWTSSLPATGDLPVAPVSRWTLDDNYDDSVGTNHLTAFNSPTFTTGQFQSSSVDMEASSNQYLQKTSPSSGITAATGFSVAAWVKMESFADDSMVLSFGDTSVVDIFARITTSGFLQLGYTGANTTDNTNALSLDVWQHCVWVHDDSANEDRLYLNGSKIFTATGRTGNPSPAGGEYVRLGQHPTTGFNEMDGKQQDVHFYNSALTDANVTSLYNLYS